jgi:hypothetical protein
MAVRGITARTENLSLPAAAARNGNIVMMCFHGVDSFQKVENVITAVGYLVCDFIPYVTQAAFRSSRFFEKFN